MSVYVSGFCEYCQLNQASDWLKVEHFRKANVIRHLTQRDCPDYETLTLQDFSGFSTLIGQKQTFLQGNVLRHLTQQVCPDNKTLH